MLSRSTRAPHQLHEENALHGRAPAGPFTKTPARQAAAGSSRQALTTGGKGMLTTVKSGRVLGAKDANGGRTPAPEATLLFPSKPKPVHRSVLTPRVSQLPIDMRTPSPGVRKFAPIHFSPEADTHVEEHEQEDDKDWGEVEVEYAGPSARDYDEPFEPEFGLPNFATAGFGAAMRGQSMGGYDDLDSWAEHDDAERHATRLDMVDTHLDQATALDPLDDPYKPIFPRPKRAPLASRSANATRVPPSASSRPSSGLSATSKCAPPAFHRTAVTPSTTAQPTSTLRRPLTSSIKPAPSVSRPTAPPLRKAESTPAVPTRSTATSAARHPLSSSLSRAPAATASTLKPRPGTLTLRHAKSSASSLAAVDEAGGRAAAQAAERELGVFGIVDGLDSLEAGGFDRFDEFAFEF